MTSKHQKLDERRQILQTTGCNEVGFLVKILYTYTKEAYSGIKRIKS